VYGSYDERVKLKSFNKSKVSDKDIRKITGKIAMSGNMVKVINLLVQMKIVVYDLIGIQRRNRDLEYSMSEYWRYHQNKGRISVHMEDCVAENDLIRCFGKMYQRYRPSKVYLRSKNQVIGKAYWVFGNLYEVGVVEGYQECWQSNMRALKVDVPMNDEFYEMAGPYLGKTTQEMSEGFLLLSIKDGVENQGYRPRGECAFKRRPCNCGVNHEEGQDKINQPVAEEYVERSYYMSASYRQPEEVKYGVAVGRKDVMGRSYFLEVEAGDIHPFNGSLENDHQGESQEMNDQKDIIK